MEKIICINSGCIDSPRSKSKVELTVGRMYDVISIDIDNDYRIVNDKGIVYLYLKERFMTVCQFRDFQISSLLLNN